MSLVFCPFLPPPLLRRFPLGQLLVANPAHMLLVAADPLLPLLLRRSVCSCICLKLCLRVVVRSRLPQLSLSLNLHLATQLLLVGFVSPPLCLPVLALLQPVPVCAVGQVIHALSTGGGEMLHGSHALMGRGGRTV